MRYLRFELLLLLAVALSGALLTLMTRVWADDPDEDAYAIVDGGLEPFRSDFNAASDHLRAVLLIGPT